MLVPILLGSGEREDAVGERTGIRRKVETDMESTQAEAEQRL